MMGDPPVSQAWTAMRSPYRAARARTRFPRDTRPRPRAEDGGLDRQRAMSAATEFVTWANRHLAVTGNQRSRAELPERARGLQPDLGRRRSGSLAATAAVLPAAPVAPMGEGARRREGVVRHVRAVPAVGRADDLRPAGALSGDGSAPHIACRSRQDRSHAHPRGLGATPRVAPGPSHAHGRGERRRTGPKARHRRSKARSCRPWEGVD